MNHTLKILAFAAIFTTTGCKSLLTKTVPAKLFDADGGEIIQAEFVFSGTTHGNIDFSFPSGEHFIGEYHTESGSYTTWGQVYGSVWNQSGSVSYSGSGSATVSPNDLRGTAIAMAETGRTIICEYVVNNSMFNPHGQGACRDNQGTTYRLMF